MNVDKEILRRLPLFEDLQEEDLDQLYPMTEVRSVPAGEWLIQEGSQGDSCYLILEGEFEVSRKVGQQDAIMATLRSGEITGEMALLDQAPRSASVRALSDSRVLVISLAAFRTLLSCSQAASISVLKKVTARLRSTESTLMQYEKMASLGVLAAGLAHELNNPAAAVRRSTAQLRESLDALQRAEEAIELLPLEGRQAQAMQELRDRVKARIDEHQPLTVAARVLAEGDLEAWLEDQGIERAWEHAPALATFGWQVDELEALAVQFPAPRFEVVLWWISHLCLVYDLIDETTRSAQSISEVVRAIKNYSYLDRAPVQDVDVHESLENTLIILRHKLGSRVTVKRCYAADLPRIEAFGGELNQAWTNIIDNAIDALEGEGEIGIRTYAMPDHIVVEITDSGTGIPPAVLPRIFDPFYTTKPMGSGSGLGLHTTYNIIVRNHNGNIQVESEPGVTCFKVTLPVRLGTSAGQSG
jgi:signal transduction histidine kinase